MGLDYPAGKQSVASPAAVERQFTTCPFAACWTLQFSSWRDRSPTNGSLDYQTDAWLQFPACHILAVNARAHWED